MIREWDWGLRSVGSGRMPETEHDPHAAKSRKYVKMTWIYGVILIVFSRDNLCPYSDNSIGVDGARALGECLKENKTLTQLNLESTSKNKCLYHVTVFN